MNYKEALKEIKFQLEDVDGYDVVYWDCIPTAILNVCVEALEKQIPEPISDDGAFGYCPSCIQIFNSELRSEYVIEYCPWCGQKLD